MKQRTKNISRTLPVIMMTLAVVLMLAAGDAAAQITGIDVSKYQGTINWTKVAKTKKVRFVYVKATEGYSIQDGYYRKNIEGAREAGLPVGSYHLYSSKTTAYQQFENFKKVVKKSEQDLIPVLDIEAVLSKNLNMQRVDKLLELMENEYGVKPIIYLSESVFYAHFNTKKYQGYKIFVANYHKTPKCSYVLWQYTPTGRISGISGNVDISRLGDDNSLNDLRIKPKGKASKKSSKPIEKSATCDVNGTEKDMVSNDTAKMSGYGW